MKASEIQAINVTTQQVAGSSGEISLTIGTAQLVNNQTNKLSMKIWTDRIGYLMVITGTILFLFQFKALILYASDYYFFGSKSIVTITNKINNGNKFIYEGNFIEEHKVYKLRSTPTKKSLYIGADKEVLVSPNFKIFMLGKVAFIPYLFSVIIFLFLSIVSVISIIKLWK